MNCRAALRVRHPVIRPGLKEVLIYPSTLTLNEYRTPERRPTEIPSLRDAGYRRLRLVVGSQSEIRSEPGQSTDGLRTSQ